MDVNEKKPYTERSMFQHRGPDISRFRQFLNFLGCLVIIPVYYVITGYTLHPLTLDVLLTIIAAEYNRFANENRRGRLYRGLDGGSQAGKDPEKAIGPGPGPEPGPECMAAIVGYREDPGLFARAWTATEPLANAGLSWLAWMETKGQTWRWSGFSSRFVRALRRS